HGQCTAGSPRKSPRRVAAFCGGRGAPAWLPCSHANPLPALPPDGAPGLLVCAVQPLLLINLQHSSVSFGPISSNRRTKSTQPFAIAASGMGLNSAVSGSCAMVTPPDSLIVRMPPEPSLPEPLNTTAMDRDP